MKVLRTARMRIITAAAITAASSFLTVSSASADPSDPICWMADAEVYCGVFENLYPGSPGYSDCVAHFWATQNSPYCEE
jgi:hypothetical protein